MQVFTFATGRSSFFQVLYQHQFVFLIQVDFVKRVISKLRFVSLAQTRPNQNHPVQSGKNLKPSTDQIWVVLLEWTCGWGALANKTKLLVNEKTKKGTNKPWPALLLPHSLPLKNLTNNKILVMNFFWMKLTNKQW